MKTTHKVIRGLFAAVACVISAFSASAETDPATVPDKTGNAAVYDGYELSWADEFNGTGKPDPANWGYELGYSVRNNEAQTYTTENAIMKDGALVIEGRKENGGYTSASIVTKGLRHFLYGRYEFRARIPTMSGAWPCMWTMGTVYSWPWGGEIDILEYYQGIMHANWYWGRWGWAHPDTGNTGTKNISYYTDKDKDWLSKFHVWRMDWTPESCKVYIDDELINSQDLSKTANIGGDTGEGGDGANPFQMPQYILLSLAMGGNNGGWINDGDLPMVMEIDYVRCYKRVSTNEGMFVPDPIDTKAETGAAYEPTTSTPARIDGYRLAWNDEFTENQFNNGESPNWWADSFTPTVANGVLSLEVTKDMSTDTKRTIHTWGKRSFSKGIIEVRARIPVTSGVYTSMATETLNSSDTCYGYMEFIDTRWLSGGMGINGWLQGDPDGNTGVWFGRGLDVFLLDDPKWAAKYHVWRYIVDDSNVKVMVDGEVLSSEPRSHYADNSHGVNVIGDANHPHYLMLSLMFNADAAVVDENGLPAKLELDYVRCYEPGSEAADQRPDGSSKISSTEFEGPYDGERHTITVNASEAGFTFEYGPTREGPWSGENPSYANVGEHAVWYRATSDSYAPVVGSKKVKITKATNAWTTQPAIGNWTIGETASSPTVAAKFGDVFVTYSGTTKDGQSIADVTVITEPGTYTAHFKVVETLNYTGLSSDVNFTVSEAQGGGDDPQEVDPTKPDPNDPAEIDGYVLSWHDEFNGDNVAPDSSNWDYELGYKVRNDESQVYVRDNAVCADGRLVITVKKEQTTFDGKTGEYSSSSIVTKGNRSFLYGKYIFRARIPMAKGTWPCMWMMGRNYTWPSGGEIDIQEYYWSGNTHWMKCNLCWNGDRDMYATEWNSQWYDITSGFGGVDAETWGNMYHVWTMDWTPERITIDVDGIQLLDQDLSKTLNKGEWGEETQGKSPFREPQYILLNLPVGGVSGGPIDNAALPQQLEVDYIRCYRKTDRPNDGLQPAESFNTTPGTGPEFVADTSAPSAPDGYKLCWNDEFNEGTQPAESRWNVQGTTHDIANGLLTMTADSNYSWGMIDTKGIRSFTNGIIEVRARIPVAKGVYTTMWTESLDVTGSKPYGFAEFLDSRYLAGSLSVVAWINWWDSEDWYDRQLTMFTAKDPDWAAKFHVWKYIIDDTDMTILIDDQPYYKRARSTMIHQGQCPFGCESNPHYLALCLKYNPEAILDPEMLPAKLDIDYVRCYIPGEEEPGGDDDPVVEPVEQPTNATMKAWFAYTAATEQVVGGAWQAVTSDGVKTFLPTAASKDGDLVYVDVKAKFPAVAVAKLPGSVTAQSALAAADGYLYVYTASGWTKLVNATVAADTEKSYRVEFDYGSENAPRLRVWEQGATDYTELKDADGTSWFALTANTFKCFTSLAFSGDGTIGDFIGTSETGPREVVTIEIPSFIDANGDVKGGVALRTVGGKSVFSVTIANGKAGVHYTAFVANTLTTDLKDWVAAADSTSPDADGLLTLDIIRDDSPAKFAKIVATPTAVKSGTTLDTLAK